MPSYESKLSEYELMRLERIRQNKAFLEGLNLDQVKKDLARPQKKRPPTVKRKRIPAAPDQLRRSSRQKDEPARFDPDALDSLLPKLKRPKGRRIKQAKAELSSEQLKKLGNASSWLKEFESFLLTVPHGRNDKVVSEANARTVLRQVRLLVSGHGVPYQHWPEGVVFAKGRPLTLRTNCMELYGEAVEFEATHGEDKGHGWLLLHPITKIMCFQAFKVDEIENEERASEVSASKRSFAETEKGGVADDEEADDGEAEAKVAVEAPRHPKKEDVLQITVKFGRWWWVATTRRSRSGNWLKPKFEGSTFTVVDFDDDDIAEYGSAFKSALSYPRVLRIMTRTAIVQLTAGAKAVKMDRRVVESESEE